MISNGVNKSAILLMLLGSEETITIFKYLKKNEIQKIMMSIMDINLISPKDINNTLHEFMLKYKNISKNFFLERDLYIKKIKASFLNEKKSENFLKNFFYKKDFLKKIKKLNSISDKHLFTLLQGEHLYIITSILFFLDSKHAANIISYFNDEKKIKIILMISNFPGLSECKISEISIVISMILSKYKKIVQKKRNIFTVINILKTISFKKSRKIINSIFNYNLALGEEILYSIFSFEDLILLTDDSIIQLMKYVDQYQIVIALYHAKKEIKYKFFQHCKQLQASIILLESNKEQYISQDVIQNAQRLIIVITKKLLKKKKISIISEVNKKNDK